MEKVFKFACALLTLLLIGQELANFAIIKPTVTSKEKKGLEIVDIPDVVICMEPGFDIEVLKQYGYTRTPLYYKGTRPSDFKFIGWNGDKNKSSLEILEEALLVKQKHIKDAKFISWAQYTGDSGDWLTTQVNLRYLAWPYGRCFSISPPLIQENKNA